MANSILFYLTPKKEVTYVGESFTIRQTIETMEHHHFMILPVLSERGEYLYSISSSDLLFYIIQHKLTMENIDENLLAEIKPERDIKATKVDGTIRDVMKLASEQNFVPVVDDRNVFMGIITRRSLMRAFNEDEFIEKLL